MDIENVKRVFFWACFLIFMIVLMVLMTSSRVALVFRMFITVLIAFFSAYYKLQKKYSFLSIVVAFFAGCVVGIVMAASMGQFWLFMILYVIVFFLSAEVIDRDLLGI